MNLVKIAEDLKDVPMQALQAYMNGQNPEVPPYLAAAELQRRQAQQQRVQSSKAAEGAGAPSIKEQLEQATVLMALQQQKQGQAMQQLMGQAGNAPAPTPEDVPQPEPQPEVEMANGGIVRLPIRDDMFEYAGGGIIGYQAGGKTYVPLAEQTNQQMQQKGSIYDPDFGKPAAARLAGRRDRKLADLQDELKSLLDAKARYQRANSDTRGIDQAIANTQRKIQETAAGAEAGIENLRIQGSQMAGITDQPPAVPAPKTPTAGLPSIAPDTIAAENKRLAGSRLANINDQPPITPPAPRSKENYADQDQPLMGPEQPTIQDEARRIIEARIRAASPEYTPEMAGEAEGKLYEQSGLGGLEAKRAQMIKDYEATKGSRGMDNLIATLAGGAQGYGGSAAAYIGAKRAQEARDLQFAKDMYGLESAPAEKRYGTQGTLYREGRGEAERGRGDQLKLAESIAGVGMKPSSKTENDLIAEVNRLESAGKHAEAQALLELIRSVKFAGPKQMTPEEIKDKALEAASKAGLRDPVDIQNFVDTWIKVRNSVQVTAPPPPSGTRATGSTMPTASEFRTLADSLAKKIKPQ